MLQHYVTRFASLQTNKNFKKWSEDTNYQAPHKPLLLLTVIDLFAQGKIVTNLIEPGSNLIERFAEYWFWIMPTGVQGELSLPFFHLTGDGFWHLLPKPGKDQIVKSLRQAPSIHQLHDLVRGAELDGALYVLFCEKESRDTLGITLVRSYFAPSIQAWLLGQPFLQPLSVEANSLREENSNSHLDRSLEPEMHKSLATTAEELSFEELPPAWPRKMLDRIPEYQIAIEVLDLPKPLYNALRRNGVTNIAILLSMSVDDLLAIRNLGEKRKSILQKALRKFLLANSPLLDSVSQSDFDGPTEQGVVPTTTQSERSDSQPEWSLISKDLTDQVKERGIPLGQLSIERLGLSSDLQTLIAKYGNTVQDVLEIRELDFVRLQDRHRLQLRIHCEHYLRECLSANSYGSEIGKTGYSPVYRSLFAETTLRDLIFDWISYLTERQRQIVIKRYGLTDGNTQTLDEIGGVIGVTRERVRQLQRSAFVKLRQMNTVVMSLEAFVEQVFMIGPGVVHDEQWDTVLSDVIDTRNINVPSAMHLFLDVMEGIATYEKGQLGLWLGGKFDRSGVNSVLKSVRSKLNERYAPIPLHELQQMVSWSGIALVDANVASEILHTLLCAHQDFKVEDDMVSLTSWEGRITDEIVLALQEIGEPAHYSKIAELVSDLLAPDQQTTARNVHAHLGRYTNLFVRVGHGVFGLKEWGLPDDGNLANAANRVLREANQPLHIDVITERVLATWRVSPTSVYMAIANDARFLSIGSGVYWLKDRVAENGKNEEAIDFADLFSDRLARWQEELDRNPANSDSFSFDEVDRIRNAGLELFE